MRDVLFRQAKKKWLSEQDADFLQKYHGRVAELNDGKNHYLEREEILNEEFGITRESLASHIEDVLSERKKKKERKKPDIVTPLDPPAEVIDGPASNGGFVASNDVINIKWVAENLPNDEAEKGQAPNSAAWGLLCWARRNPDQFYTQIYKQVVIPTKREIEEASDAANDEDRLIEALDRVKAIAGELIDR